MTAVVPIENAKPRPPRSGRSASACCWSISAPPTPRMPGACGSICKEFLSDRPGDRESGAVLEADAERHHPARPPAPQGARLPEDLEHREERIPAQDHHPRAVRQARRRIADHDHVVVDWAMRYGNPSIASRIEALIAQGCDRLLVVPLYPQYSAATSATVCDEVFRVLAGMRAQPTLRVTPALLRRPRLYRGAGGLDRCASRDPAVPAGADRGLVPRHAAEICRQGRSLPGAMHRDDGGAAQAHGPRRLESCC